MERTPERGGLLSSLRDAWRHAGTRRVLSGFDDRRLKDIGLAGRPNRPIAIVHEPTQRWLDGLR